MDRVAADVERFEYRLNQRVAGSNGTAQPAKETYQALAKNGFADWALEIGGLVESPARLTLTQLRAMPSRTKITRHDCVEGWSAIDEWTGVPLAEVLRQVRLRPEVRYVVFHCADPMDGTTSFYYESIDMDDAWHLQTILAYGLNDATLPIANGAPVRVWIKRSWGTRWPDSSCASSWWTVSRTLAPVRAVTGRIRGISGTPI